MKKIRFLYGFVILSLLIFIIRFMSLLITIPKGLKLKIVLTNTPFLIFLGLIFIERGLYFSIKKGYFNTQSMFKFITGGYIFIFSGIFTLVKSMLLLTKNEDPLIKMFLQQSISQSFVILVIGLGLVVISDFIKKGNLLQEENDLTI